MSIIPGGREESVVLSFAVQEAPTNDVPEPDEPAGVQVTADPRFELPLRN
jgi:hypothetical protein